MRVDLLARERRAGGRAARGIADQAGDVADQEDHRVAQVLEVLQLADQHGVAEVQVGRGGIESGLDAQRLAGLAGVFQALAQIRFANDLGSALLDVVELLVNGTEVRHGR